MYIHLWRYYTFTYVHACKMCMCLYTYTYIYMYSQTPSLTHTQTKTCIHTHAHKHTPTHTFTQTHTQTHKQTHRQTHTSISMTFSSANLRSSMSCALRRRAFRFAGNCTPVTLYVQCDAFICLAWRNSCVWRDSSKLETRRVMLRRCTFITLHGCALIYVYGYVGSCTPGYICMRVRAHTRSRIKICVYIRGVAARDPKGHFDCFFFEVTLNRENKI